MRRRERRSLARERTETRAYREPIEGLEPIEGPIEGLRRTYILAVSVLSYVGTYGGWHEARVHVQEGTVNEHEPAYICTCMYVYV